MDENTNISPCKDEKDVGLEVQMQGESEHLRQHLAERDAHIAALEAEFLKTTVRVTDLEEQLSTSREKYDRLYDSHKRVQKLNQVLEDKLLQMVDKMKSEKSQLTKDIATLSVRLAESKHNVSVLQKENERYKNDMNLAIQLLQCKPDNFVSQKLDNLPIDTQARVSQYVMSKTKTQTNGQTKSVSDTEHFDSTEYEFNISASLMSKILEDSIQDTITKHCDTCTCNKSQSKPFSYNDTHYSVATQTILREPMKLSLCLNCKTEIKSTPSNVSVKNTSPKSLKNINDKNVLVSTSNSLLNVKQPSEDVLCFTEETLNIKHINRDINPLENSPTLDVNIQSNGAKVDVKHTKKNVNLEPTVHHKLCDRMTNSITSIKGSNSSVINDSVKNVPHTKDAISKTENSVDILDNHSLRKKSQSSMGAVSRTSSVTKSTSSAHKCNTQVGPGPRFCSLRVQAGSKNILLDNAQPDVPPVLYTRQSKCTENVIFKDLSEGVDNFINLDKSEGCIESNTRNENNVVESTLIDVHIDNNNKDASCSSKSNSINPVLLNVSSSPLQPLKTHNYQSTSEKNSTALDHYERNASEIVNLLSDIDFNTKAKINKEERKLEETEEKNAQNNTLDYNGIRIFNFDHYEQNKLGIQLKPLHKVDMSQLPCIENTSISKDFPPLGEMPKIQKNISVIAKSTVPIPTIVNVYPNLTQTHLKVNESKKVFTNEQSTSSLSSDDSAALLQKQQLLRVAQWVEQNLEQQNNLNDPTGLDDDINFNKSGRRDSKIGRAIENLDNALKMPHPVSKYSNSFTRDDGTNWLLRSIPKEQADHHLNANIIKTKVNITKETIFPVDSGDTTSVIGIVDSNDRGANNNFLVDLSRGKEISAEEFARMEYNVKKFLLSGPQWVNPKATSRTRRTSSKTETDV